MSNDPLASLLDYVGTVKPYHTKIYEVLLEYVYTEPVRTTVTESYHIYTTLMSAESNNWIICPGVGWDTAPFGVGLYDYPLTCNELSPSRIQTTVLEHIKIDVTMYPNELAFTYVQDHTGPVGYDTTRWDHTGWDSMKVENWLQVEDARGTEEPVGTTITESLTIQII